MFFGRSICLLLNKNLVFCTLIVKKIQHSFEKLLFIKNFLQMNLLVHVSSNKPFGVRFIDKTTPHSTLNSNGFLVACTRLYNPLCRSVGPSVRPSIRRSVHHTLLFLGFCGFWPHCSCPNDGVTSIITDEF